MYSKSSYITEAVERPQTGVGSVRLSSDTVLGSLAIEAQEYTLGSDRTLIVQARIGSHSMYRALFAQDDESIVFLHIRDGDHTTTLVLADTDDPQTGSLTIWNDAESPQHFSIDVPRFIETRSHRDSIKGGLSYPDHVGRRKPVALDPVALYRLFGKQAEYRAFLRGEEPELARAAYAGREAADEVNWKCAWMCLVPACGLVCLFWKPNKKKKPDAEVITRAAITVDNYRPQEGVVVQALP